MDPIISVAVEALGKTIVNEAKKLGGVKGQVDKIIVELRWMQGFLQDADGRVSSQSQQPQSKVFREWVVQVREASLDAEDIINTYLAKLALRRRGGVVNRIKTYASVTKHGIDMHGLASEIETLKSGISSLTSRLQAYGMKELGLGEAASSSSSGPKSLLRRTYGHTHDRNVVGLEENVNDVIGLLLKEEEGCKVVSIHGMGGLGKTTLAKKVYYDNRVKEHFDNVAWVYVSQQVKQRDVWESTLVGLTGVGRKEISELTDDELAARLSGVQEGQKCLVVLDDVWSIRDWENLQAGFCLEETSSSKILFTTRKKELAEHVDRRGSYGGLKPLSDTKSLELLRKIALQRGGHEIADKKTMEDLEKGMLKQCGGLPLAIIVLGGILASKDSLREWQTVHDNINTYLRRGKGQDQEQGLGVHQVLAYSYYDLPSQLKTCFLYLSQFPEDYEIRTGKLMRMWIAEGFVSVQYDGQGEETVEDVAERYLNELVGRCMVEVGKKGSTGGIKTCRLHDLMRDLCLSKAKEENLIHNYEKEGTIMNAVVPTGKMRRLSLVEDTIEDATISLSNYERNSQIRSLILQNRKRNAVGEFPRLGPVLLWNSFKLLRMLVLEWVDMSDVKGLSKEIGKLIHLRYLSLRGSEIYDWPSFDKLGCMETLNLDVRKVTGLLKVSDIWKMKQLRHLYFPSCFTAYSTAGADTEIESKPNLQTLVNFPPPECRVDGILRFPNVRKLEIKQGKHVVQLWETLNNNKTFRFSRLYSFTLTSTGGRDIYEKVDLEAVVAKCPCLYKLDVYGPIKEFPQFNQFPTNLTELILKFSGISDPEHIETTLGNLPHLTTLELGCISFSGERLSFKKDTFPQLTTLRLWWLSKLKSWEVEKGAMPNLQLLEIEEVSELEAIPEGLKFIATLNELQIKYMPAEFEARVKEGGADFDIVKHVPSITILVQSVVRRTRK